MALTNFKRSAFFLKVGASLPVPTANFLELTEALAISATIDTDEFDRVNGLLGQGDFTVDSCSARIEGLSSGHKMRASNFAGTALETPPEYKDSLQMSAFKYEVAETLVLASVVGIVLGDTITGDTSTATGTVKAIDTVLSTITIGDITNSPFEVGGEALNTAAYTSTSAGSSPRFTNTHNPLVGSAINYLDGNKHTMTDGVICDTSFDFTLGVGAMMNMSFSSYLDAEGIPTAEATPDVTSVLNVNPVIVVGCADIMLTGGTALRADNITITANPVTANRRGFGKQAFEIVDYKFEITATFLPENADYADAITKIRDATKEAIKIQIGLDSSSLPVNGKTVEVLANIAKAKTVSDANDNSSLKRTFTWQLQGNEQISIKHGFFL